MNVDHLLKQSCTIATGATPNRYGKLTYGSTTTYPCRFQKTSRTIATVQSEKTPIDGIVWLAASATATLSDKLTFDTRTYKIMRIEPMVDGAGITRHLELMVQEWST